jgi:hypothetical protein
VITEEDRESAKASKEEGNQAFKEKRYKEAVQLYTQAIGGCLVLLNVDNTSVSISFTEFFSSCFFFL